MWVWFLASVAAAHDFAELPGAAPELSATTGTDARQALQLMVLPFMPERERFATLAAIGSEARTPEVDAVFQQCEAAFKDGVRPGETGYHEPAKRQQAGIVVDCMDAAHALAEQQGVLALKGEAAAAFAEGFKRPQFAVPECPSLVSGVGFPTPAKPTALSSHEGERFASVVVRVSRSGDAVVLGRLYGDEAASKACWAAVDGPWTPGTRRRGAPASSCFHHRCAFR